MIQKSSLYKRLILVVFASQLSLEGNAQQDAQYTQYMYNTMVINPAYAGQRETLSITSLYRTQWIGVDGAPETLTIGVHSPLRNERIGLGLSIVSDRLGPVQETFVNGNFSYTIPIDDDEDKKMSFGLNAGFNLLETDWSKGIYQNPDNAFNENINLFSPMAGAGVYLHSRKWYVGLSVPNIIKTDHYDDYQESLVTERLHYYLIGGYVFDLSETTKLKPAFLLKGASGSPAIADISANFLFNEKFTIGMGWRWDDSISALAGFQISNSIYIGYAYDKTTTGLKNYNEGSHEIMLRFELQKVERLLSPRFF